MRKKRKQYTPEEKVAMLRKHLIEMTWEEEDWVEEDSTAHRGPDE